MIADIKWKPSKLGKQNRFGTHLFPMIDNIVVSWAVQLITLLICFFYISSLKNGIPWYENQQPWALPTSQTSTAINSHQQPLSPGRLCWFASRSERHHPSESQPRCATGAPVVAIIGGGGGPLGRYPAMEWQSWNIDSIVTAQKENPTK